MPFEALGKRSLQPYCCGSAASPRGTRGRPNRAAAPGTGSARCRAEPAQGYGLHAGRHSAHPEKGSEPSIAARQSHSCTAPVTRRRPQPAGPAGRAERAGPSPAGTNAGPPRPPTISQRRAPHIPAPHHHLDVLALLLLLGAAAQGAEGSHGGTGAKRCGRARARVGRARRRQRRFEPRTARPGQSAAAAGHHGTDFKSWGWRAPKRRHCPALRTVRHRLRARERAVLPAALCCRSR